jgi:fatty-acyl-CoA synthase
MQPLSDYPSAGQRAELLIHRLLSGRSPGLRGRRSCTATSRELTYLELHQRIQRLGNALTGLGVRPGDRVGVLDWDSHRYLECFFAIPMLGATLHTINGRLSPDQTLYTIRHAGDRLLLVHPDFLPLAIADRARTCPSWKR